VGAHGRRIAAAIGLTLTLLPLHAQDRFPGIARAATPAELAAWDIDVRADFKGLPAGSGSTKKGQDVWEAKCASCHGVFGESNEVFSPLVGGTTANDVKEGRVATLSRTDYPGRTTLMKLVSLSTLWDYINRAMPWNQPKSLSVEEVYAVTAWMLHLGGVVPAEFTLSDRNIREVQAMLPNRQGGTTDHALWPGPELGGKARPDVQAQACMRDCPAPTKVVSKLPDFARDAHGNLAEQNRTVGPQRGAMTARAAAAVVAQGTAPAAPTAPRAPTDLLQKNTCTACHAPAQKLVGPSWADIAGRHAGKGDYLADKIRSGGAGVWGNIPMPPQALGAQEAQRIAQWLAEGARP
jgi:cytochrome c